MPNYDTKFTFVIPVKEGQVDWTLSLADCVKKIVNYWEADKKEVLKKEFDDETISAAGRIADPEDHRDFHVKQVPEGVLVYAEDAPSIDVIISFVQTVLTKFDSPEIVCFEWSEVAHGLCFAPFTPDSMETCGGGAVGVSRDGHMSCRTERWLETAKNELTAVAARLA